MDGSAFFPRNCSVGGRGSISKEKCWGGEGSRIGEFGGGESKIFETAVSPSKQTDSVVVKTSP